MGIGKKRLELRALFADAARLLLHVFFVDGIAVGLRKTSQLGQLILRALTFTLGRDTSIESDGCHALKVLQ
jgi:hypothetical protein